MKVSKQQAARWLSLLAAWLLSLLAVLLTIVLLVDTTLCSVDFLKKQTRESGFAALASTELTDNYVSYGAAGGFPAELMEGFVSAADIQTGIEESAEALYQQGVDSPQYPDKEQAIYDALTGYVAGTGNTLSEESAQAVQTMASICRADFEGKVTIPFLGYLRPMLVVVSGKVWLIAGCLALGMAVALWLLYTLNRPARASAYVCQALIAATVCGALAPLSVRALLPRGQLIISPESLRVLIETYLYAVLGSMWPFVIILALLAAIFGVLSVLLKGARPRPKRRAVR